MQKLCERVFLASSLLKFDVQLGGSALILWLKKGFSKWTENEALVVGFGSLITAAWIIIGFLSVINKSNLIQVYF